ncbi:D-glucuronyl C5-epimerase family protein [Aquibacillus rhizosphaerae]|uniref:D-glucuronyl C5-epimerase family protein n=1 Tax=Aquibacillus rhizosphaerae TaxID=3051431 RepID=A0ABT7L1N7_9BACI|nr:D-glucuronyl C5-epimerase family protein [Aquibacillus sp. LR5S19]MDL4839761.1 D-glucuronyl C5-epimerase family protein [Aquibacillus sp. LR5S19]
MDLNQIDDIRVVMHDQHEAVGKKIGNIFYVPISLLEKGYSIEKVWKEKDKTLEVYVTLAKPTKINQYDYTGNYLHYDKNKVENWNVEFDNDGIPKTVYSYGKYYNPSTIAQYGLQHYSLYCRNANELSKNKFLTIADWFLKNQDSRGGWAYKFDLPFYPSRLNILKAPWYSAIGLGMAMSVLSRASYLTKDKKYSEQALKANHLFKTPPPVGIQATFENEYLFYEECPTEPGSFILNGFMFSLIGLNDLYKETDNRDTKYLYDKGISSLKRMLPLYDLGNRTAYDLTHYTTGAGQPNVAKWGYHITHIHLLEALNSIEKDDKMNETIIRWKKYLKGTTQ